MQNTSLSYLRHKTTLEGKPEQLIVRWTEASIWRMSVDSTSQQQQLQKIKNSPLTILCLCSNTQHLIQWLPLFGMWLSFSIHFWSSNLEILHHLSFIT